MGNRNAPLIFLLCLTGRVWLGQSAAAQAQTPTNLALGKPRSRARIRVGMRATQWTATRAVSGRTGR
jgi:hypothetical protein